MLNSDANKWKKKIMILSSFFNHNYMLVHELLIWGINHVTKGYSITIVR